MIDTSSLKKRYSIKLLANIITGLLNAIVIAIIPKVLGPITYGQFIYLQDFFMKIIGFLDMGSSIAFFTKLSAKHERQELITFYFFYIGVVLLILIVFIWIVKTFGFTEFILPEIPNEYIYMGAFFGFFTWLTQIFIKISDAYALTASVELIKIGHKILSLLLLLYFIYFTVFDLNSYFIFNYIALLSFLVILSWLYSKKGIFTDIFNFQFSFSRIMKEFYEYCHPLLAYSITGLIVGFLNIWMLQKYGGSSQTGFYGLAYSLAAMCFLFTSALTPIITREFSKAYGENDIGKMGRLFSRYIPMFYSIAAFLGVFISIQSENVLSIFTDEKFQGAYTVLMLMALYPIHQTYGQLSSSVFYATGQTKLYRNIAFFIQPLMLLLSYIFIVIFDLGAIGLTLSMIIIQLLGVNIGLYFNTKFLGLDLKYFVFHQVYSVVFFFIIAYLSSLWVQLDSSLLTFLISGIIYTIFAIMFSYIFPQIFATNRDEIKIHFNKVLERVVKK